MKYVYNYIIATLKRLIRHRHLRFDILSSFFVIQVLTASSIVYYTYSSNSESMLELAQKMMDDLSESKIARIKNRFEGVQTAVLMGSYIIKNPQEVNTKNKVLIDYSIAVVKRYPFIESLFIGTEAGRFFQVKLLPPNSTYRSNSRLLPQRAKIAVRVIDRDVPNNPTETWSYLDDDAKTLEVERLAQSEVVYNHKLREWYQKALQTRSQIWSSIYIFSTTKLPGVANSAPLSTNTGNYFGVIGSDVPLDSFTEILQNIHFDGISMILTQKGEVIASSFQPNTEKVAKSEGATQLTTVNDLTNKLPAEAFRQHQVNNKGKFIFNFNNKTYIATFKAYDRAMFKDWVYVFVMPIDSLIGEIKVTQQNTLLISFIILILSIAFITYLAHRVAKPITQLTDQANSISSFDLSHPEPVKSGIKEIQELQASINTMRTSLVSFGKYVPKKLVRKLLENGNEVKIGGKAKKLTIMFTDIADFTTITESYPADKLVVHLSEYFEELTQIIDDTNGTIDKFIGDAIMSFWGAPSADKDQAMNACAAALLCQKRLSDLNRKWNFEKKPVLETRIGVHSGEAIVGNMGSTWRMFYTALGDSINAASRLEGLNKHYHTKVIISDEVVHQIADYVVVRPLDIVAVKGKKKGIKIYELVALKNSNPLLLPTDENINFCSKFERAVTLYRDKRWDEALEILIQIETEYGKDYAAEVYIERCKYYKKNPPLANWDGVFVMKEK